MSFHDNKENPVLTDSTLSTYRGGCVLYSSIGLTTGLNLLALAE